MNANQKAHLNALRRDYADTMQQFNKAQAKRAYWSEVVGGFVLTATGLFIGYLIAAAF